MAPSSPGLRGTSYPGSAPKKTHPLSPQQRGERARKRASFFQLSTINSQPSTHSNQPPWKPLPKTPPCALIQTWQQATLQTLPRSETPDLKRLNGSHVGASPYYETDNCSRLPFFGNW